MILDQSELTSAQQFLEAAAQQNLPELLKTLSDILFHCGNSGVARRQAGLQLKNQLTSNDEHVGGEITRTMVGPSGTSPNLREIQHRWQFGHGGLSAFRRGAVRAIRGRCGDPQGSLARFNSNLGG